jgi:hypothetical protein
LIGPLTTPPDNDGCGRRSREHLSARLTDRCTTMKALGVVVVLVVLSLLMLTMAVRIVKQYENGVPALIRTTL